MGGLTVIYGLAPGWVIAHLLLSMAILVAAGTLVWRARPESDEGPEPRRATLGLARGIWAMFALGGLTIAAGTFATAAGPHAGGEGTGDIVNRLEFKGARTLNWLVERHGVLAAALGLLAVALWFAARRTRRRASSSTGSTRICLLLALQGALGSRSSPRAPGRARVGARRARDAAVGRDRRSRRSRRGRRCGRLAPEARRVRRGRSAPVAP